MKAGEVHREANEHEVFARSRARIYIGRQSYLDQLDAHARADGLSLVILGESGSGKSALLANWAVRYRVANPDDLQLMHFIGVTLPCADWVAMLPASWASSNESLTFKMTFQTSRTPCEAPSPTGLTQLVSYSHLRTQTNHNKQTLKKRMPDTLLTNTTPSIWDTTLSVGAALWS